MRQPRALTIVQHNRNRTSLRNVLKEPLDGLPIKGTREISTRYDDRIIRTGLCGLFRQPDRLACGANGGANNDGSGGEIRTVESGTCRADELYSFRGGQVMRFPHGTADQDADVRCCDADDVFLECWDVCGLLGGRNAIAGKGGWRAGGR
jgi:hypothetical protein